MNIMGISWVNLINKQVLSIIMIKSDSAKPWIITYIPKNLAEVVGQDEATSQIRAFVEDFKNQKKKGMLLYGPSGSGKTVSAHAIAKELGLEIIEVNASDVRNKDQIIKRVGSAATQMSLFSKGKIILLDEVDGLSGTKDRGGIPAIISIIKKSPFPILLTALSPWNNKFSSLRSKTQLVQFSPISHNDVAAVLQKICNNENIEAEEGTLITIGRRCAGDLRAAINDLQTVYVQTGNITRKGIDELGSRNQTDSVIDALRKIFKTTNPKIAITALDNIEEDLDTAMLWIDENLPKEYDKPEDLARAYDMLSKANIFSRRIKRWQHWRFLIYINAMISAGVAVSKDEKYRKFVEYKPTGRILKMWWAKQKTMKKKAIAEKIAAHTHTSSKAAIKNIDYFKLMFKNDKAMAESIAEYVNLDKEEIAWLKR